MGVSVSESATRVLRGLARPLVRLAREIPPQAGGLWPGRGGPRLVCLPCEGRQGAALLRIYNMAGGLRARGWRVLVLSPRLTLAQRHRCIARLDPDLLLMQGARHVLNRPDLYPAWPVVFDMDDADFHLPHLAEPVRRAMPKVRLVLAGSRYVADWCRDAGAGEAHVVWTGAPVSKAPRPPHVTRPPVVAWAQTRPMTYRREADMVRQVMAALSRDHPDLRLRLFDRQPGDDPGFAEWFRAAGIRTEWAEKALYRDYIRLFDDVSLGLAPLSDETPFSRGKSFGKVLAMLDRHVPVIASDLGEHGAFFTDTTGIVSNRFDDWVSGAARLLADPAARQAMAEAAAAAFRDRLSETAAVHRTDAILRASLHNQPYARDRA